MSCKSGMKKKVNQGGEMSTMTRLWIARMK
jgi:hypothetical protein